MQISLKVEGEGVDREVAATRILGQLVNPGNTGRLDLANGGGVIKKDRRRILRFDFPEAAAGQLLCRQGNDEIEISTLLAEEKVAHGTADEEDPCVQLRREEGAQE
jgi:hypothetical protein